MLHAETKDTPDAPAAAKKELEKLSPMSRDEWIRLLLIIQFIAQQH
jgi:di/tricarboxylate transporter